MNATTAKEPRTERGRRTMRALLDAAAIEFGTRGFHESSVVSITARAGVALGSFYTYFDSKESLFRALVTDMSAQVGRVGAEAAQGAETILDGERAVLAAFIGFAREHQELYRIIDEAEFVDAPTYRAHYEQAVARIGARLKQGVVHNELRADIGEIEAWAIMGMNVFLGLRYGVLAHDTAPEKVATAVNALLTSGLMRA